MKIPVPKMEEGIPCSQNKIWTLKSPINTTWRKFDEIAKLDPAYAQLEKLARTYLDDKINGPGSRNLANMPRVARNSVSTHILLLFAVSLIMLFS